MMQSKAHSKFDMAVVRQRAKKLLKKKYKKNIKLSTVDKIWKEYVEYGVVRRVIRYGRADMGSLKIIVSNRPVTQRMSNVVGVKKLVNKEVVYGLEFVDENCSDYIVFTPHKNFKKRFLEHLKNPGTVYRNEHK